MIEVFAIPPSFQEFAKILQTAGLPLLVLFFVISIGIHALRGFESINFESKIFNFVLSSLLISLWPMILVGIKELIDNFNYVLAHDVFKMNWDQSFGQSWTNQLANSLTQDIAFWNAPLKVINSILVLLLITSQKIIYAFFLLYFFLYAAIGPIVIARGVFSDELNVFLELVQEVVILLLWQSTFILLIGLLDSTIGSTSSFLGSYESAFSHMGYALLLTIVILFIPLITRKIAVSIGLGMMSPIARLGATMVGLGVASKAFNLIAGPAKLAGPLGAPFQSLAGAFAHGKHYLSEGVGLAEEFRLHNAAHSAEHHLHHARHALHEANHEHEDHDEHDAHGEHEHHEEHHHDEHHHEEHAHEEHHAEHHHDEHHHESHAGHGHTGHHETHGSSHGHAGGHDGHSTDILSNAPSKPPGRTVKSIVKVLLGKPGSLDLEQINFLKQEISFIRGHKNSDKYNDMALLGVDHNAYSESSVQKLTQYRDALNRFHAKFGWLYNFQGKFIAEDVSLRPKSWDQPNSPTEGPK